MACLSAGLLRVFSLQLPTHEGANQNQYLDPIRFRDDRNWTPHRSVHVNQQLEQGLPKAEAKYASSS